jgi:hypothetical protein
LVNNHRLDACSISQVDQSAQLFKYFCNDRPINVIDITLSGKNQHDTELDADGSIINDIFLVIERLQIDHIDLINKLDKISVYIDEQGQRHRTYNYISFNGRFRIKIHHNLLYTEWMASFH